MSAPAPNDFEVPQSLRPLDELCRRRAPVDRHHPLERKQIAGLEVDKEQRGTWLAKEIAERVVVAITLKIRNGQGVTFHAHEARPTAAMGNVDAGSDREFCSRAARHEECVGMPD